VGSHSTKIVLSFGGLNFGGGPANVRKDLDVEAAKSSSASLSDDEDQENSEEEDSMADIIESQGEDDA